MEGPHTLIYAGNDEKFPVKLYTSRPSFNKRYFRAHRHKEFEISLFKTGSGIYKTINKDYDINTGDIFLFSTDEIHCITEIDSQMEIMNMQFEPRFIWASSNELFDAKYLEIFLRKTDKFDNRLDRNNPHIKEIRSLLCDIEWEFTNKPEEYELMIKAQLLTLLVKIKRYFMQSENSDFYLKSNNFKDIENAMDYIDKNFCSKITLEEISSVANMSKNYFCTVFKKLNGLSAWDYITLKRIEKSKQLLKSKDRLNMLELAQMCGFSGTAGFNKAFKHCTGLTPSAYLKSM